MSKNEEISEINDKNRQTIEINVKASDLVQKAIEIENLKKELETIKEEKRFLEENAQNQKRPQSGGVVGLNPTQGGEYPQKQQTSDTFDSPKEMMDELRLREKMNNPLAKKQIDSLFAIYIKNVKTGKDSLRFEQPTENIAIAEDANRLYREEMRRRNVA